MAEPKNDTMQLDGIVKKVSRVRTQAGLQVIILDRAGCLYNTLFSPDYFDANALDKELGSNLMDTISNVLSEGMNVSVTVEKPNKEIPYPIYKAVSQYKIIKDRAPEE